MDETTTDVVQPEGGEQIAPQSEPSPEVVGQDSPGGESKIEALSQEVNRLSGMVKAFQSDEDRRIPAIERQLKTQAEQLEAYHQRREAGQTHEQALREQALDELVASKIGDAPVPPKEVPAEQPQVAVNDYLSKILNIAGLDENDAAVLDIIRANPNDVLKQADAVAALSAQRKQTQQTPPTTVLSSGGGQAIEGESLESITEELDELYTKPVTAATRARIQELGNKQRELLPKQ